MAEWFDMEVVRAGAADDSNILIFLRPLGNEFVPRWFVAAPQVKKEMLATALTAITTQLRVTAALATRDEYSTVERLYVRRDL